MTTKISEFRQVEDNSGCEHRFIVGPQRLSECLHIGHCDKCKREVALELDESGGRTGKSWLVESLQ